MTKTFVRKRNKNYPNYYIPNNTREAKCLSRLKIEVVTDVLKELGYDFKMNLFNRDTCYLHIFKRKPHSFFLKKKFEVRSSMIDVPPIPFGYYYEGYKFQPLYFRTWIKK